MKKILYFLGIMLAAWIFAACSEEEFEGANGQLPLAEEIDATISVDQMTNQVTFRLNNKGCYPIWRIYKTPGKATVTTVNGYQDIIAIAGTYTVEVQVGNRNGICNGYKTYEFTLDNTIVDWSPYVTFLAGGANKSKRWEMARTMANHLGCGPSGTDGLEWWHAGADEKTGTGVYETRMEFANTGDGGSNVGVYKLDPADGGMLYVNTGVTKSPYGELNPNDGNDFSVPFELTESEYTLSIEGTDLFIEFPANVTLPYIASDYIVANPKFRIQSLTRNKMELVSDEPGVIAWHYIFVPEGSQDTPGVTPDPSVSWVDESSADNLMNGGALALSSIFWADNNWGEIGKPDIEFNGNSAKVTVNEANGASQWQGQVHLNTGIAIEEGKSYDFKIVLNPSSDIAGVTVKPHPEGDDGNFFSEARNDLFMGEDNSIEYINCSMAASTSNLVITLDFPGCAAGTSIDIKGIIVQEHREGSGGGTSGTTWVDESSADNLMNSGALALSSIFWADNNWGEIGKPDVEFNGNSAKVTVNEANGASQWQGQIHLNTGVAIEADKSYDFKIVLNPSSDIAGVTVKPHPEGDDGNFFSEARHDLFMMEDNSIEYINCSMAASTSNLVITLDFPGCAAGTTIDVKGIIIQEHK